MQRRQFLELVQLKRCLSTGRLDSNFRKLSTAPPMTTPKRCRHVNVTRVCGASSGVSAEAGQLSQQQSQQDDDDARATSANQSTGLPRAPFTHMASWLGASCITLRVVMAPRALQMFVVVVSSRRQIGIGAPKAALQNANNNKRGRPLLSPPS